MIPLTVTKDNALVHLIGEEWYRSIGGIFNTPQLIRTANLVEEDRKTHKVYPKRSEVFKAYKLVQPSQANVIIVGQDPYHDGNADGLSFSASIKMSPSLQVIQEAINEDIEFGQAIDKPCFLEWETGEPVDLTYWANQGILLLNSCLTVREGVPKSHSEYGWNYFVRESLKVLLQSQQPKCFLLWGSAAKDVIGNIDAHKTAFSHHCFIVASHPMAEVYGESVNKFFGLKMFSRCNKFLKKNKLLEIIW